MGKWTLADAWGLVQLACQTDNIPVGEVLKRFGEWELDSLQYEYVVVRDENSVEHKLDKNIENWTFNEVQTIIDGIRHIHRGRDYQSAEWIIDRFKNEDLVTLYQYYVVWKRKYKRSLEKHKSLNEET